MVAIMLFGIAGMLSVREGYHKILHPEPISHLGLNYLALGFAFVFEIFAFRIAIRNIKKEMKREKYQSFWKAIQNSKDPTTLTVLFEDFLALLGLLIAAIGISLVHFTGLLIIDGFASILIGALLMVFAVFLAFETKKLLVGEAVSRSNREKILDAVKSFPEIRKLISLKTMHLSSEEVLVALEVNYRDDLKSDDIEKLNDRLEEEIMKIIPDAKVYIEAES
jgi:divalent metal cation (Fe/Co/Zn/Cd) transporter